jgi:hypothetical protein
MRLRGGPQTRAETGWILTLALGVGGFTAVVVVDVAARALALNDDWMYAWDVRHLVTTRTLLLFPDQQPTSLVHVVWAAIITLGSSDPMALRLSAAPFLAILGFFLWRLSRDAGADRFWAAVATGAALTSPFYLYLAASFHTEVAYLALLMAAAWSANRWLSGRGGIALTVALAILATLERQWGIGLALVVPAILLSRRRAAFRRTDIMGIAALIGGTVAAATLPLYTGLTTPAMSHAPIVLDLVSITTALATLLRFGPILGVICIPFLLGFISWRPPQGSRASRIALILGAMGIASAISNARGIGALLGIDLASGAGIGPLTSPGQKSPLFAAGTFQVFEVALVATFVILLVLRSRLWSVAWKNNTGAILISIAGTQLAAALARGYIDRYMIVIVLPLLPVLAAEASRVPQPSWAKGWAVASMATALAAFVAGEQDMLAWQTARDHVARQAYALAAPIDVQAGYEPNAVYAEIPYFESTGTTPTKKVNDVYSAWALYGPVHPAYVLCFAKSGNPMSGENYSSLASGRIVIEKEDGSKPCSQSRAADRGR